MKPLAPEKEKKSRAALVLRASLVVFLFVVVAKFLNFFKKILIGQLFGVSRVADAFFAASFLPYYLAIFFEGVIFLGFLPIFSQVRAQKGEREAQKFLGEILLVIFLLTLVLTAIGWWGAPWIVRELVPGFNAMDQDLTRSLFQALSFVLVFITLTSFFKALNSFFEHYAWAASSAFVDSLVMILITLVTWRLGGIRAVAWAAVGGALTALVLQAGFFFQKHPVSFKGPFFYNAWLGKLFLFLIPMGAVWAFQQIPLVIFNRFGSGMWKGTISALVISHTLTTVPMGLVNHTVLFAIFPFLAKQAHETGPEEIRKTFFQTLRGGFLILLPIGFLMSAFAWPLAALFFEGGGIVPEGTRRIANSLVAFGWATFALYADLFMTQSLIAVRKTLPAIFLSASRAVLTYAIGYVLSTYWDYQGLAFSFSLALALNFFFLFPFFFRMSPFVGGWMELFRYTLKLGIAASPAFLIGGLLNHWAAGGWLNLSQAKLILILAAGFASGLGLYLWLLFLMGTREIRTVFSEFRKAWERKSWWLAEQTE